MQTSFRPSTYIVDQNPGKYGGHQSDYQERSGAIIERAVRKIQETPKTMEDLTKLFFVLLADFQEERQRIAREHKTPTAEAFGRRRDTEGRKDFYFTTLEAEYREYNSKVLSLFAVPMMNMNLMTKSSEPKSVKLTDEWLGQTTTLELEIFENERLTQLNWLSPPHVSELPDDFPMDLYHKQQKTSLSDAELSIYLAGMKKFKAEYPVMYKRMKMVALMLKMQEEFPSPKYTPLPGGGYSFDGKEGNLKSFFVLGTARWQIPSADGKINAYATTQFLTWLYRNHRDQPVPKMMRDSTMMLIHPEKFFIPDLLQQIAKIFAQSILWDNKNTQDLKNSCLLFRHGFSTAMPTERGSGAISEWFEVTIYNFHRFLEFRYNKGKSVDLEALTAPLLSHFAARYDSMVELGERRAEYSDASLVGSSGQNT